MKLSDLALQHIHCQLKFTNSATCVLEGLQAMGQIQLQLLHPACVRGAGSLRPIDALNQRNNFRLQFVDG